MPIPFQLGNNNLLKCYVNIYLGHVCSFLYPATKLQTMKVVCLVRKSMEQTMKLHET